MEDFEFIKVGTIGCGLTNQLGFIASGITYGKINRKRFIVLDNFNTQYNRISPKPINKILDLDHLNKILLPFNLHVIDINEISVEIISVRYGTFSDIIDITDEVKEKYIKNGVLIIPKNANINLLKGDPKPNVEKKIFIKYSVNHITSTCLYNEHRDQDISFDLSKLVPSNDLSWIATYDIEFYNMILTNIKFCPEFNALADNIKINSTTQINLIHIRDDNDAINFWGCNNKVPIFEFKEILTQKYIALIDKYINKHDLLIVLTSNLESNVVKYLSHNKYNYIITDKFYPNDRELNAIIDLLICKKCNNIFIGNINPNNFHGSRFSYLIWKHMSNNVTNILIDLDSIYMPEYIK